MPEARAGTELFGGRPREALAAESLGYALQVMLATDRRSWRMASLQAFLEPPARLGQIEFLMNSHGQPRAFATWAFLTEEVEADLARDPARVLELEEWNEGTRLWIMDVVAPAGGATSLLLGLKRRLNSHHTASWLRADRTMAPRRIHLADPASSGRELRHA